MSEHDNSDEVVKSKKSSDLHSYLVVAGILAIVAVVSIILTKLPKIPKIDLCGIINRAWMYSLGLSDGGSGVGYYLYWLVSIVIFISPILINLFLVVFLRKKRKRRWR